MDFRSYVHLFVDNSYVHLLTENSTEAFSILFLPSIIVGLAIGYAFIQVPSFGRKHGRLIFATAGTLVFVPPALLFTIFLDGSELIIFYQNTFGLLLGLLFIAPVFQRVSRKDRFIQFGIVLLGLLLSAFFSWRLVGDFLLPRRTVDGVVTAKRELSDGYQLTINGRGYATTWLSFKKVVKGQIVHAEVGAASGTIFRAEPAINSR